MQHQSLPWTRLAAIVFGTIALASLANPAVGAESVPTETCPEGTVTVVVDFTDLGGEVEIGCATDASTGAAALVSAGFTDTRDAAGMICAIDTLPDPCPATFTGDWWSYWYAEDGEWLTWMEGSDTAVPVAGGTEGWRYNDGSAGPGLDPAALPVAADAEVAEDATPEPTPIATMPEVAETSPWVPVLFGGAALAAVLVVAAQVMRSRRSSHGPDGQD